MTLSIKTLGIMAQLTDNKHNVTRNNDSQYILKNVIRLSVFLHIVIKLCCHYASLFFNAVMHSAVNAEHRYCIIILCVLMLSLFLLVAFIMSVVDKLLIRGVMLCVAVFSVVGLNVVAPL
jgi:hypothetical protein